MRRSGSRWSIATQVLIAQLGVVALVAVLASAVALRANRSQVERLSGERALSIARSVAALDVIVDSFASDDPSAVIQPIAESVRISSGADFVVVANLDQVRYSHPDPEKIGQRLSTPAGHVLDGEDFIGTERGTLGRSVRGKTPIRDANGEVIGIVSVGLLIDGVTERSRADLLRLIAYLCGAALVLGGIGSALIARRVNRQTHSLDEDSIGALLEHREAILGSVKEGVLALDPGGRVTLTNLEAQRLLGIARVEPGDRIDSLGIDSETVRILTTPSPDSDRVVVVEDRLLVANRRPITIRGDEIGAIVTLRDRTELDSLHAQLAGTKAATETLRTQAHEYSNRLHTIAGLLALESHDEVRRFVSTALASHTEADAEVARCIDDPTVRALLVAKFAQARERHIDFHLDPESHLPRVDEDRAADLLVVLGNLVDNALQAVGHGGWVDVVIDTDQTRTEITVSDSGDGVPAQHLGEIFGTGFSTKRGTHAGLGLALARRACRGRGGDVSLAASDPTTFVAVLPLEHDHDSVESGVRAR